MVRGQIGQGEEWGDVTSLGTLPKAADGIVRTASFDALGHVFSVTSDDAWIAELVDGSFAALATGTEPTGCYEVRHADPGFFDLHWMDETVAARTDRAGILAWLQWDVNRRAVAAADAELVLHAGCVARGGRAVLVSGPSGSGKSTLVAALVARGFEYLTDEAVPVDLVSAGIRPFPRPLALDDRSLDLLPEVVPLRTPPSHLDYKRVVAIGPATRHRDPGPPLRVVMVVFPERDHSGLTVLHPVGRADAVVRLAHQAFNLPRHGRAGVDALAALVRGAEPYQIVGTDPRAAASAVIDALGQTTESEPGRAQP